MGQGSNRIASRIDSGLGNRSWMDLYGSVEMVYMTPGLSDHSPLVYFCATVATDGFVPFRFLNAIASHESFKDIVAQSWSSPILGSPMHRVWVKLKRLKPSLKELNVKHFAHISEQVERARTSLAVVKRNLQDDMANSEF